MKIKALFAVCFAGLALFLSSCSLVSNSFSSKESPTLYPIVQGSGPNSKFGYIDTSGEIVIKPQFQQAWFFSEGLAVACIEREKCGYIDEKGNFVINPQFQLASRFSEGLAGVVVGDKIGYVDKTGKYVVNPQFEMSKGGNDWQTVFGIFSEGLASVKVGGKSGYIDKTGKIVINPQFEIAQPFMESLAAVKVGEKWGYIDKEGKIVVNPQFEMAQPFVNGLAAAQMGDQWGYIDKTGKIVINPQFDFAAPFASEGAAVVFLKDKAGFIDKEGKYLVNPQFSVPSGSARSAAAVLVAAFIITPDLGRLSASEGMGVATAGESWPANMKFGFVGENGQFKINPQFSLAFPFYGDLALVMFERDRFGWINKEGRIVWQQTMETPKPVSNMNTSYNSNYSTGNTMTANSMGNVNMPSNMTPTSSKKTGRLTTDSNIRSEANKDATSLGIHFKGARVQILDKTSYASGDNGELVTWYKVRVIEYGCSAKAELGCGKNSSNDSDVGWMNAKNILLD